MKLIFSNGTLDFEAEFYSRIELLNLTHKNNGTSLELPNYSLLSGKILLKLLRSGIDSHWWQPDINLILKKYNLKVVTEVLELCNYLMVNDDNFLYHVTAYIYELFVNVLKIENQRCEGTYVTSSLVIIRGLFGLESEGNLFMPIKLNYEIPKQEFELIRNLPLRRREDRYIVPYFCNLTFLKEPVVWSKDVIQLILKNQERSLGECYESFFALLINIHLQYRSYFTEHEIQMNLDREYFLTHTTRLSNRIEDNGPLVGAGNIELIISLARKGVSGFAAKDIPTDELIEAVYLKRGMKGIHLLVENSELFEGLVSENLKRIPNKLPPRKLVHYLTSAQRSKTLETYFSDEYHCKHTDDFTVCDDCKEEHVCDEHCKKKCWLFRDQKCDCEVCQLKAKEKKKRGTVKGLLGEDDEW